MRHSDATATLGGHIPPYAVKPSQAAQPPEADDVAGEHWADDDVRKRILARETKGHVSGDGDEQVDAGVARHGRDGAPGAWRGE